MRTDVDPECLTLPKARWISRYGLWLLGIMRLAPLAVLTMWALREQTVHLVVAILLAGALEFCVLVAAMRSWRSFFLAGLPIFLLGGLFAAYTLMYGSPPGRSLALIFLTTSPEEVAGFLRVSGATLPVVVSLSVVALYAYIAWKLPRTPRAAKGSGPLARRLLLASLVLAAAYIAQYPADLIDGVSYSPTTGTAMFFAFTIPNARRALYGSDLVKVPYHGHRVGGEEVHVLVLGESARRDSWSAYGYTRVTTPYLDSIKSEAIFLQHATADANLTTWSVPILLTGMTPEEFAQRQPIHGNIFDLAKEAGYRTTWILNQDITISLTVGIDPDQFFYPADFKSNIHDRHTLDEALLPYYQHEIARTGAARFIGIHTMGSHWEYYRRYPASFSRFGSDDGLSLISIFTSGQVVQSKVADTYDNTVLYTDWFLKQVIESARTLAVPVTVTFFPDHGEDLEKLDGRPGHGAPEYTQHAFEIPAFVWVNEAYRNAHPQKVVQLRSNANREIRSHDLFNTLADLMGITWPGAASARSFASDEFTPDSSAKFAAGGVLLTRPSASHNRDQESAGNAHASTEPSRGGS